MSATLVVIPCGQGKIWDKYPNLGPVIAREAYTGAPFKVNREFAERFATERLVLSAKYGFISPDFVIPGPYEVTFKRRRTGPIAVSTLRYQVREQCLERFQVVIGLGGKEYVSAIREAFAPMSDRLAFPFAGLQIGKMMQATRKAIESGVPCSGWPPNDEMRTRQAQATGPRRWSQCSPDVGGPMPSFRLTLANTYWTKGFFNVGVESERYVTQTEGPFEIYLGDAATPIVGRVTRSANQNATPRIAGNKALAVFFQTQFKPGDSVRIEFISPTAIRVGGRGPAAAP